MMRFAIRYWLISLLLAPTCALAFEIGEIQVQSSLKQLFDATIPLPTLTPEQINRVSVKLASPAMFKEFGLDRTAVLSNLVLSIQYNAEGLVYLKMVSTQPIQEPSLAILLEFNWPRGKTFREFTVFLDPVQRLAQKTNDRTKTVLNTPATPENTASIPSKDSLANDNDTAANNDVAVPAPPIIAPPEAVALYKPGDFYGPVVSGEGLWSIALKTKFPGVSREQMMQTIFNINPQAFSSAGIPGLKTGAKLRIPTYQEITAATGAVIDDKTLLSETKPTEEKPAAPTLSSATENTSAADKIETFPLAKLAIPEPVANIEIQEASPAPTKAASQKNIEPVSAQPIAATPSPYLIASEILLDNKRWLAAPTWQSASVATQKSGAIPEKTVQLTQPSAVKITKTTELKRQTAPLTTVSTANAMPRASSAVTPLLPTAAAEILANASHWQLVHIGQPLNITAEKTTSTIQRAPFKKKQLSILQRPLTAIHDTEPKLTAAPSATPLLSTAVAELLADGNQWQVITIGQPLLNSSARSNKPLQHLRLHSKPLPIFQPVPQIVTRTESKMPESVSATPLLSMLAAESLAQHQQNLVMLERAPFSATTPGKQLKPLPAIANDKQPPQNIYKGGEAYGPISNNERLWDIAGKITPDPSIGRDTMMKALLLTNPQAFAKPDINYLKIGAILRIPTLEEIVKHTDSSAAKNLLQQTKKNGKNQKP